MINDELRYNIVSYRLNPCLCFEGTIEGLTGREAGIESVRFDGKVSLLLPVA